MKTSCKIVGCGKVFDFDTQPICCPHEKFPEKCKKHNRFNCDNLECKGYQANLTLISEKRKEKC